MLLLIKQVIDVKNFQQERNERMHTRNRVRSIENTRIAFRLILFIPISNRAIVTNTASVCTNIQRKNNFPSNLIQHNFFLQS